MNPSLTCPDHKPLPLEHLSSNQACHVFLFFFSGRHAVYLAPPPPLTCPSIPLLALPLAKIFPFLHRPFFFFFSKATPVQLVGLMSGQVHPTPTNPVPCRIHSSVLTLFFGGGGSDELSGESRVRFDWCYLVVFPAVIYTLKATKTHGHSTATTAQALNTMFCQLL